ncbi:poly(A) polymerase [Ectothiorhodospira magna]|uniref:Poly(A) polymerase I n=1 Tax=Ectothiorhodospira magna TaxID=867345 RepID=A0A1H9F419_9GAMM|nr:polynucleotide adenylyltransferase PcnB [Ectothiorhodospira magna]SEQ32692.1 poly(A) polymerase [Ectothiorhodospira magna]
MSNEIQPVQSETGDHAPRVYARAEHVISRAHISDNALKVLYRLKDAGFRACLVGGGVRDLLLGREPKDFDVATDAHPEQVRRLFRNCRLIGRRFRLAHVFYGQEIIEVATFRAPHDNFADDGDTANGGQALVEDGRIIRDNVYGTIEQDAWRRDFSVNALYYDIENFSVVDYTGGMDDLKQGVLRLIGDPEVRYREDPVRMLRAVRFATKLGFRLDKATQEALLRLGPLLQDVPPARLFDEVIKLFHAGYGLQTFEALRHYGLFGQIFPLTEDALAHEEDGFPITFVANALNNTDERIQSGKGVNPAFLYAVLLWEPVRHVVGQLMDDGEAELPALQHAGGVILSRQARHILIPKRFALPMREIWELQPRFEQRRGARALRLLGHPRFRAAYDFYCLRAASGEALSEGCEWWTRLQAVDEAEQRRMVDVADKKTRTRRRRRSRRSVSGNA